MHYRFILPVLIFLLSAPQIQAQFNDSTHYMAAVTANGNFNQTNDGLTMLYNNSIRFGTKFDRFHFNSSGSWLYGKNPQKVSNNDWNALMDFNLFSNHPPFYYWGLFNFTSSLSLGINHQFQSGLGVAYRFLDKQNFNFSISNGILYELSNVKTADTDELVYQTFRNSLRVRLNYTYKDIVKASGVMFYQPSLNYRKDYIITSNANIQVKIWKWVSLNTTLSYNKVSRTNKENIIFTYGIIAERFF